jgi:hypothetical protein
MRGRYGVVIMRVIGAAAAATVLVLGALVVAMLRMSDAGSDAEPLRGQGSPPHDQPSRVSRWSSNETADMWPRTRPSPELASMVVGRADALHSSSLEPRRLLLIAGLIIVYPVQYRRRVPKNVRATTDGGSPPPHEAGNMYVADEQRMWKCQPWMRSKPGRYHDVRAVVPYSRTARRDGHDSAPGLGGR